MGVVYEARDTRLERRVALKLLPPDVSADRERRQRFVHEARAAGSLNHSNIVTIHDIHVGLEGGIDMIVMEYVDGRSLAELVPPTGLRFPVAMNYAIQIADALAAAQQAGIVHRDLKPSNVMVAADGRVKVVDFGIAKLVDRSSATDDTRTGLTADGVILGTTPYMSPEQIEGGQVDARSDIFSFGCLLYEMLCGRRPFEDKSPLATMARILKEEPTPLPQLAPSVPSEVAKIVARCLRKDPVRRFQHMADVKVALQDVQDESAPVAPKGASPRQWRQAAVALSVAVATIAAAGYFVWGIRHAARELPAPTVVQLTTFPGAEKYPTFAPDGQQIAFTWSGDSQDNDDVYVQRIGSGQPLRLTRDPAVDLSPAWSPDGNWIAFLRGDVPGRCELRMVPPLGGVERKIADVTITQSYAQPPYLSWLPDSHSLVVIDSLGDTGPDALFIVSADTGDKRRLSSPAPNRAHSAPSVSPDGRSIVFVEGSDLRLMTLDETRTAAIGVRALAEPGFAPQTPAWTRDGRELIVSAGRRLWRMTVDDPRRRSELPYVGDAAFTPTIARGGSAGGDRLAYVRGGVDPNIWRITALSPGARGSAPTLLIASTLVDANPQPSPKGDRVAFQSARAGSVNVWVADISGANPVRLTSEQFAGSPRWSPDGGTIVFDTWRDGQWDIYSISADGGKTKQITSASSDENVPSFSHDGKWIYYASNRTGRYEVWKTPVSGGDGVPVTNNGAYLAFESDDGSDLYYTQRQVGDSSLWQMPASGGEPHKLLDSVAGRAFDVVSGGLVYVEPVRDRPALPFAWGMIGWPIRNPVGRLRYLDFHSGRTATISDPIEGIALGLGASRDGRTVLFTRADSPLSDVMMIDNFR
jgi:Tol biopolymer transport system component